MRLAAYTALTMLAFAANSLLCRLALKETSIDAASSPPFACFPERQCSGY